MPVRFQNEILIIFLYMCNSNKCPAMRFVVFLKFLEFYYNDKPICVDLTKQILNVLNDDR